MRLLLHACCGPCSLEPYALLADEHEVDIVYANPNIHPFAEWERRLETLSVWALARGVGVEVEEYDPAAWMRALAGVEADPEARCRACYRLRLESVAEKAGQNGYDAFATTLTVSPYQDPEAIREAGEAAGVGRRVNYLHRDFRDRYQVAARRSREMGMYRQNYCGCLLSELEAREQRTRRREERRVKRASPSPQDRPEEEREGED